MNHWGRKTRYALVVLSVVGAACSDTGTPVAPGVPTGGTRTSDTLEVTVTAPNGDPISEATVWIDDASTTSVVKLGHKAEFTDPEGNTCEEGPSTASVVACTNAEGLALLPCDGLTGEVDIHFAKGSFAGVVQGNCTIPSAVTAFFNTGATNIAVVTGEYDTIQDVLAKLGFGTIDSSGHLQMGTQGFTFYDGNNTLDDTHVEFADALLDPTRLAEHDIIFINCDEFSMGNELATDTETKLANLRQYVENGGKLYVTDLSYDYVEQAFPEYIDFFGGGVAGSTPELAGAAENGLEYTDPNATVNDASLGNWLDAVRVNSGNVEANCFLTSPNAATGARNPDGSIFIGDLLGGWALIDGAEPGAPGPVTEWIVGTDLENATRRPLTVTFDHGEGRVLYTSYHTAHTCPSTGFWPQERVLQFLVFAL